MPKAEDPVHECNGSWWFWNETWSDAEGPYLTEEEAVEACKEYARSL